MKKIYIAGKISGECETPELMEKCYKKFVSYISKIAFEQNGVPWNYFHGLDINRDLIQSGKGDYIQYMKNDLTVLMTCDEVHFLPDWIDSRGAKMERILAEFLGMVIVDAKQPDAPII